MRRRVLIRLLAVIAVIAILALAFNAAISRLVPAGEPDRYISTMFSPAGNHKAVRVTYVGSGFVAFCTDVIAVLPYSAPDEIAASDERYQVLSVACDTFADQHASPKIEWLSDTELQITIKTVSPQARKPELKPHDASGAISLRLVEQD